MIRPLVLIGCVLLGAVSVRAQDQKWNAFIGYQFTSFQVLHGFAANPPKAKGSGVNAAVSYNITRWMAAKADFANSYGSGGTQLGVSNGSASLLTYTFGPEFSVPAQKVKPFVEFLAGGYKNQVQYFSTSPFSGLALLAGGGVDAQIRKDFAVRIFQFDWLGFMTGTNGFSYGSKSNFRFVTGLVIHF